ncbi:MAG: hypothetical protein M1453_00385 [Acidobacteria bacterium]|nr:hypothetical protein [Acidobacteriota bacterium]MCL5286444.1 hypothetical protein [Acidobacteriota bacterium]
MMTVFAIALGLFIIVRFWSSIEAYLLVLLSSAVLSVLAIWMDAIRDHKRIQAAMRTKSSDELARQALNLAAGQAFALGQGVFFLMAVLFVLAKLLMQLKGR